MATWASASAQQPKVVKALRIHEPKAYLDVHLCVTQPAQYLEELAKAGGAWWSPRGNGEPVEALGVALPKAKVIDCCWFESGYNQPRKRGCFPTTTCSSCGPLVSHCTPGWSLFPKGSSWWGESTRGDAYDPYGTVVISVGITQLFSISTIICGRLQQWWYIPYSYTIVISIHYNSVHIWILLSSHFLSSTPIILWTGSSWYSRYWMVISILITIV